MEETYTETQGQGAARWTQRPATNRERLERVLDCLERDARMRVSDIAKETLIHPSTVSRMITFLRYWYALGVTFEARPALEPPALVVELVSASVSRLPVPSAPAGAEARPESPPEAGEVISGSHPPAGMAPGATCAGAEVPHE
ncbi:MAG: helix-turn-helix domain-containing protein [Actinomycetota bacterium]|nr:helix-turn-helix domain-containing protein [Actinomycetota bacterium]